MGWWTVILKEFSILSFHIFFLQFNCCISLPSSYFDPQKPMMRGSPGPPSGMRGGPGPNFANINNIHQVDKQTKESKNNSTTSNSARSTWSHARGRTSCRCVIVTHYHPHHSHPHHSHPHHSHPHIIIIYILTPFCMPNILIPILALIILIIVIFRPGWTSSRRGPRRSTCWLEWSSLPSLLSSTCLIGLSTLRKRPTRT